LFKRCSHYKVRSLELIISSHGLLGFSDDCVGYFTSNNVYRSSITCGFGQHCCGTCNDRYCCYFGSTKLSRHEQSMCNINSSIVIGLSVVGFVVFIIVFITCCCCPCCSVVGTHITTVMNTQCIQQQQQPVMQGGQYPQYQPVPTQPGYGGQPMQTGPYQGQSYAPGPPPSYHVASQAMYPMQPPAQPGVAPMLSETSNQPAYNPAYMQPPNTGY
uniref:Protein shisa-5-like n=1 Tax=Sinocyclocheilus grahami TaxID=75366 RepID=A0A672QMV1_SINGR